MADKFFLPDKISGQINFQIGAQVLKKLVVHLSRPVRPLVAAQVQVKLLYRISCKYGTPSVSNYATLDF